MQNPLKIMKDRKEEYSEFISEIDNPSLFIQPWWLDTVCGFDNWDVLLIRRDNRIVASLPIFCKKVFFFNVLSIPPLTQSVQPLFKLTTKSRNSTFDAEMKLLKKMVDEIPKNNLFRMNLNPVISNWLPFYWKGYTQSTLYSYVIDLTQPADSIWESMSGNRRKNIRKAIKNKVKIKFNCGMDQFYPLYEETFKRKGRKVPYSKDFLVNLERNCKKNNSSNILISEDEMGVPLSGAFLVWDSETTYYLLGGLNSESLSEGAQSLLLWEAIKFSSSNTNKFDFEGSMDKNIEHFFRSFGAKQTPYFSVEKINSIVLTLLINMRRLFRDADI